MIIVPKLFCPYQPGQTVVAMLWYPDGSKIWNTNTLAWESYNAGHVANYQISVTDPNNIGVYFGVFPSQIVGVLPIEVFYNTAVGLNNPIYTTQSQGQNIGAIVGDAVAPANMQQSASTMVIGAAVTGTLSSTQMTTNLTDAIANIYVGRTLYWVTGSLAGAAAAITAYAVSGGLLTFTPVPGTPANGDTFVIV